MLLDTTGDHQSWYRIATVVFMGRGEPLANLKNLLRAIRIINAPWGLGIGARHITVSTSGLAPQIRELANESTQFRLALSTFEKHQGASNQGEKCHRCTINTERIFSFHEILSPRK